MTKKEKQMEKYMKDLCRDAGVDYDPEFGSHMDDPELNELLKRDIQKQLDYMVAEGFCDQVGDKYVYRENPVDLYQKPRRNKLTNP
jgi:hypothetical protein